MKTFVVIWKRAAHLISLTALTAFFALTIHESAFAKRVDASKEPAQPTEVELRLLPEYCTAKFLPGLVESSPLKQKWRSFLGPDYEHIHHLCQGMNYINRAYNSLDPDMRQFNLTKALNNFEYMIGHVAPDFKLFGDLYYHKAMATTLRGNEPEAAIYLRKAIEQDPRHVRSYSKLAEYYTNSKQTAKALELVTEGLRHVPESTSLKKMYDRFGGKQPYPEPYAPPKPDVAEAEPKKLDNQESVQAEKPDSPKQGQTEQSPPTNNPWCRFCPEEDRRPPSP